MLTGAKYGKSNVRVLKVKKLTATHHVVSELRVEVLLQGEVDESYTKADNASIVPTDTIKNTIYILARDADTVEPIEQFGATLCNHFVSKYKHIYGAEAKIIQYKWERYVDPNSKEAHPHSFILRKGETREAHVTLSENKGFEIDSYIVGLGVLKSTGSAFHGYNKCEYTTLKETNDRILATDILAKWTWKGPLQLSAITELAKSGRFDEAYEGARDITIHRFAHENSASVQATMYNMGQDILNRFEEINSVHYEMPNKHYFEVNLDWFERKSDNVIYAPQSDPNGLIFCTVTRPRAKL